MKFSTPDEPKTPTPRSILLIGPPGGGKTTLMLQFPNLVVLDCDQNLDGPERYLRQKDDSLSYNYEPICYNDDNSPRPVEDCYDHLMNSLDNVQNSDCETVAVDSITMVNEFIIRKILTQQKKPMMEINHWQPFKSFMLKFCTRLRGLGKTTIVTCHETKREEADPKNLMKPIVVAYEPSIQGSVCDFFGAFFTDVWRCTAEPSPSGLDFTLWPVRTTKSDLKNSLGIPDKITNIDYSKLIPYLV